MKRPPIPTSYLVAGGIAAAATLWLVGGSLLNAAGERETPPPIGERAQAETERPSVRTRLVVAENHEARITLANPAAGDERGNRKVVHGDLAGLDGETILLDDRKSGRVTFPFADVQTAKLVLTDRLLAATRPLDTSGADEFEDEAGPADAGALQEQED